MSNISLGNAGEEIAAEYLRREGYQLLARNFRAKSGEIDIIAEKKGFVCFIEVKTRTSCRFGTPAEAVTYQKQRKIINTALSYLKATGNTDMPFRFDIIEVLRSAAGCKAECNHIINAFGN